MTTGLFASPRHAAARRLVPLIVGVAAIWSSLSESATLAATRVPKRVALLIAIENYSATSGALPRLYGPLNDLRLMKHVLVTYLGFAAEDIDTLQNAQATRAAIEAHVEQLIEAAEPGDLVYVHFMGHGSTVSDVNGDEGGRRPDSTLVPIDGRQRGSREVIDDEIEIWSSRLRIKGAHVVLVFDSCHSGTAHRGPNARAERGATSVDSRDYSWSGKLKQSLELLRKAVKTSSGTEVKLSACLDEQKAYEFQDRDRRFHGIFTWSLAQALRAASPIATWRDILGSTRAIMLPIRYKGQWADGEGELDRTLTGHRRVGGKRTLAFSARRGPIVRFVGGAFEGITVGSVYAPETGDQPRVVIESVGATGCRGKIQGDATLYDLEEGMLFRELLHEHSVVSDYVSIEADRSVSPALVTTLRSELMALPNVILDQRRASIIIKLVRDVAKKVTMVSVLGADGEELGGASADQEPLLIALDGKASQTGGIVQRVRQLLAARRIETTLAPFAGPTPWLDVNLVAGDTTGEKSDWKWLGPLHAVEPLVEAPTQTTVYSVPTGTGVRFELTNRSADDLFVYLINLPPSGAPRMVFPQIDEPYVRLAPGQSLDDPDLYRGRVVDRPGSIDTFLLVISPVPTRVGVLVSEDTSGLRALGEQSPVDALWERAAIGSTRSSGGASTRIAPDGLWLRRMVIKIASAS